MLSFALDYDISISSHVFDILCHYVSPRNIFFILDSVINLNTIIQILVWIYIWIRAPRQIVGCIGGFPALFSFCNNWKDKPCVIKSKTDGSKSVLGYFLDLLCTWPTVYLKIRTMIYSIKLTPFIPNFAGLLALVVPMYISFCTLETRNTL